jgi:uncharacterized membrane protein YeaQ/YmgE (transglycosylase-associated protein family)
MHIAAIILLVVGLVAALFLVGTAMTILYYLAAGLVVGALGRLVLPGREKIGLLGTALIGIAGSVIGGVAGRALHVGRVLELVFAVAAAAVLLTVFGFRARSGEE